MHLVPLEWSRMRTISSSNASSLVDVLCVGAAPAPAPAPAGFLDSDFTRTRSATDVVLRQTGQTSISSITDEKHS